MYQDSPIDSASQELEAVLRDIPVHQPGINRDMLMYRAGQVSVKGHRPWQALSAVLLVVLAISLWPENKPSPPGTSIQWANNSITGSRPEEEGSQQTIPKQAYIKVRQTVLTHENWEHLPSHSGRGSKPSSTSERQAWFKKLL